MYELGDEMRPVKWRAMCGCEEKAEYQFTGQTLLSCPAQHVHKCEKCGKKENFEKVYPFIDFEERWVK